MALATFSTDELLKEIYRRNSPNFPPPAPVATALSGPASADPVAAPPPAAPVAAPPPAAAAPKPAAGSDDEEDEKCDDCFRIAFFSTCDYDRKAFNNALEARADQFPKKLEVTYYTTPLGPETVRLVGQDHHALCIFVNDDCDHQVVRWLHRYSNCKLILLRCAGFNNVNIVEAAVKGLSVARVPEYSPYAVAEQAVALCMALNRKVHQAYQRVRMGNFSLVGLEGFDMHAATVGIIGTGKIGKCAARIFLGFGCRVLAYNRSVHQDLVDLGVEYLPLEDLLPQCDVISIHAVYVKATHHLINAERIKLMKPGAMLINASRGALLNSEDVLDGLKSGQIGSFGMDVYERESEMFFQDKSGQVNQDDCFNLLLSCPNVICTGHQGFLTREALGNIADHTLDNVLAHMTGQACKNAVKAEAKDIEEAKKLGNKKKWKSMKSATKFGLTI